MRYAKPLACLAVILISCSAEAETGDAKFVRECGQEWQQHKADHGKPQRGTGHDAWLTFQSQCLENKRRTNATPVERKRIRVVDGDTIELDGIRRRFRGCDTPEIKDARCDAERERGERAKARLEQLIDSGEVKIYTRTPKDRYDRPLIDLFVAETDVCSTLMNEGLAVR